MALAEKSPSARLESTLSRPLVSSLSINWELVAYGLVIMVAIGTRFWDLGARALHHDESLHALYSWYLYTGKGYQHDPMMHGPFQFHAVALTYLLFGASDYTARVVAALFGVWVAIAPYFLRREMGRPAALFASAIFTISPSFLYFSRFIRNDIYMAGWAMIIVIGIFGFLREKRPFYFYLIAIGTAFSFATKETVYITGFSMVMFLILEAIVARLRRRTPVGWVLIRSASPRTWAIAIALFIGINLVLYTTFFTNPKGVISGTYGAIKYWLDQHDVQRGGQPWFYYLILLPQYEFLPIIGAIGGLVVVMAKRIRLNLFAWFMIAWLLIGLTVYSWAGEKMPWLDLHIAQPLIFLAALALGGLVNRASLSMFTEGRGLVALLFAALIAAAFLGGIVAAPPLAGTQLGIQSAQLQRMGIWVLIFALLAALAVMGRRHGAGTVLVPASLGLTAVLLALTVRTAWGVSYTRGDTPTEMLVYVQTSPDVPRIVEEIERLSYQTGAGKDMQIYLDGGYTDTVGGQSVVHESIAWPFEWYLRDWRGKVYYSKNLPTPTEAPVILAMVANEDPIKGSLGNYVGQRGRLNWWFPEDYKNLTWDKVWSSLTDASVRSKLWRYFLYREPFNTLGSRDIDFYVRSDLARGMAIQPSSVPQAVSPVAAAPAPATDTILQSVPGGISIFGKSASGASALVEPRDVALGPNGLLYTIDSSASRVVAFRPDGTIAYQWGKKGTADGEFTEPWGVTVAPTGEVYVADTWNHRVQKFDSSGKFLAKWGSFADSKGQIGQQPGNFWGPRDIAIAPNGDLLVTDGGNKRVQVFDGNGRFITMFGGDGTEPGKMKEPVGIAVDGQGFIYVADTWNRRIQKFDSRYQPVAQFPAPNWDTQNVTNKPYLALDGEGRIFYTEPDKGRFVVLSPSGQQEATRGIQGSDPTSLNIPTGITVSSRGEVYIGDGRNGRIVRYDSWR